MCEALDIIEARGRQEGRQEGIIILVTTMRELNATEEQILSKLEDKYHMSEEDARKFL